MVLHIAGLGIEGVKEDQAVFVPGGLGCVVMQVGEHTAVLHGVAIKGNVVTGFKNIALLPGIDGAGGAVLLVVIPVQVIVGVVHGGLHNGVVYLGAVNTQPAHKILVGILLIERLVIPALRIGGLGLGGGLSGFFLGGGLRGCHGGGRHRGNQVFPQLFVQVCVFLGRHEILEQVDGAAQQRDCQHNDNGYVDAFLFLVHGVSSCNCLTLFLSNCNLSVTIIIQLPISVNAEYALFIIS